MELAVQVPYLLRYETKLKDARKFRASFLLSFSVRLFPLRLLCLNRTLLSEIARCLVGFGFKGFAEIVNIRKTAKLGNF